MGDISYLGKHCDGFKAGVEQVFLINADKSRYTSMCHYKLVPKKQIHLKWFEFFCHIFLWFPKAQTTMNVLKDWMPDSFSLPEVWTHFFLDE